MERKRNPDEMIDPQWRKWLAECLRYGNEYVVQVSRLIQEGCARADARNEDLLSFETSRLISNLYIVLSSLAELCSEAYDLTGEQDFLRDYIEYRRQELGILKIKSIKIPRKLRGE